MHRSKDVAKYLQVTNVRHAYLYWERGFTLSTHQKNLKGQDPTAPTNTCQPDKQRQSHFSRHFCKQNQLGAQIFLICLWLFSTCFGQLCAHHQEKIPYLCDTCRKCKAEWNIPPCIPDSHLYRVTNARCRIGTVFSPDDEHTFARNMYRKAINILKNCLQIWFCLQDCTRMHGQQNTKLYRHNPNM